MLVRVSQCCRPVPGDAIVGFITTGPGISIHKAECANLRGTDPPLAGGERTGAVRLHRSSS